MVGLETLYRKRERLSQAGAQNELFNWLRFVLFPFYILSILSSYISFKWKAIEADMTDRISDKFKIVSTVTSVTEERKTQTENEEGSKEVLIREE